jgi:hypothetical protein
MRRPSARRVAAVALAVALLSGSSGAHEPARADDAPGLAARNLVYLQMDLEAGESWELSCWLRFPDASDPALFDYFRVEDASGYGEAFWRATPTGIEAWGEVAGVRRGREFRPSAGEDGTYWYEGPYWMAGQAGPAVTITVALAAWNSDLGSCEATSDSGAETAHQLDPSRARLFRLSDFRALAQGSVGLASAAVRSRLTINHSGLLVHWFGPNATGISGASAQRSKVEGPGVSRTSWGSILESRTASDGEWTYRIDGVDSGLDSTPLLTLNLPES